MKIFDCQTIREWDAYTINQEPIESVDLMERAVRALFDEIKKIFDNQTPLFYIFCGPGNNGGDGIALARMLQTNGFEAKVILPAKNTRLSHDATINLERWQKLNGEVLYFESFHKNEINDGSIFIDAIFGSGLNKPVVDGIFAEMIQFINNRPNMTISVDIPSGLFADRLNNKGDNIVKANLTITFQVPKLSFFFYENYQYTGDVSVIDIQLSLDFYRERTSTYHWVTIHDVKNIFRPRKRDAHKYHYGHALLIAGTDKTGAGLLAAKAVMRCGCGLLSCLMPKDKQNALFCHVPEAMAYDLKEFNDNSQFLNNKKIDALGIGPGLGLDEEKKLLLKNLIHQFKGPMVVDADALTILSDNPTWIAFLPPGSVLTPHTGELKRLIGHFSDSMEMWQKSRDFAVRFHCYLVVKNFYSIIFTPNKEMYFITNGDAGMAKAGSGDVLTGIILSLLAQGYPPKDAALLGSFMHAECGRMAAADFSSTAMTPKDIIHTLPRFMTMLENSHDLRIS